jgi:hypothetical protein
MQAKVIIYLFLCSISVSVLGAQERGDKNTPGKRLSSITCAGETTSKYVYNQPGQLIEQQSSMLWTRFYYDHNKRLVKKECALHPDVYSSSRSPQRSRQLITAVTATINSYQLYEYDNEGRINIIRHYSRDENKAFEYRSGTQLFYDGDNIVKWMIHHANGIPSQYSTFEYDSKGNVTSESYYSCNNNYLIPSLISKTTYTYDNKENPHRASHAFDLPPYETSVNNIIESRCTLYERTSAAGTVTVRKSNYVYNNHGLPSQEISGTAKFDYHYE